MWKMIRIERLVTQSNIYQAIPNLIKHNNSSILNKPLYWIIIVVLVNGGPQWVKCTSLAHEIFNCLGSG